MPPNPPSKAHAWLRHAQHVASRHANFQIAKKKFLAPLPNPGDALGKGVERRYSVFFMAFHVIPLLSATVLQIVLDHY